jgi:hypothetical protein
MEHAEAERVRCSSLVDWPVYPRFAHTMRAPNEAQCGHTRSQLGHLVQSCAKNQKIGRQ